MSLTNNPLKKGKTLFLFDIDGTLTPSRQSIQKEMIDCLTQVKTIPNIDIASIGGSDLVKAKEQLKEYTSLFKYLFTENGVVSYDNQGKIFHSKKISEYLGEDNLKELINFVLRYVADLDIPVKRGTFLEFRTGMLNVSPIGRNCSKEERAAFAEYNKEHKVVETFRNIMNDKFAEKMKLKFSIGGQISFDIFPIGWDKTYCLQFVKDYDNIVFFGDKTQDGGNDHEIAISPYITRGVHVDNPQDTIVKINSIVEEVKKL